MQWETHSVRSEISIYRAKVTDSKLQYLGLLPWEDIATKVTISCCLLKNWGLQLEILDDSAGPEIEIRLDNLGELGGGLDSGPVVEHGDGERLGHPDSVGDLHQAPPDQPGPHQGLGHPSGCVGGTPVHLDGREIMTLKNLRFTLV